MNRMHPDDLRAQLAMEFYKITAAANNDVSHEHALRWGVESADRLLDKLKHTAQPVEPQEDFRRLVITWRDGEEQWCLHVPHSPYAEKLQAFLDRPRDSGAADSALRKLSMALNNPALETKEHQTLEDALVEFAIARLAKPDMVKVMPEGRMVPVMDRMNELHGELAKAKTLLQDAMDIMESRRLEREAIRTNIAPIVAIFGIREWGSDAYVLESVPDQIQEAINEARVQGYRSALNDKTNGELGAIEVRAREDGARDERNRIRPLFEELMGNVEIPDRNCSCHISPPCQDCVENSGLRETASTILAALERP